MAILGAFGHDGSSTTGSLPILSRNLVPELHIDLSTNSPAIKRRSGIAFACSTIRVVAKMLAELGGSGRIDNPSAARITVFDWLGNLFVRSATCTD
jgi:hypothetical protein